MQLCKLKNKNNQDYIIIMIYRNVQLLTSIVYYLFSLEVEYSETIELFLF